MTSLSAIPWPVAASSMMNDPPHLTTASTSSFPSLSTCLSFDTSSKYSAYDGSSRHGKRNAAQSDFYLPTKRIKGMQDAFQGLSIIEGQNNKPNDSPSNIFQASIMPENDVMLDASDLEDDDASSDENITVLPPILHKQVHFNPVDAKIEDLIRKSRFRAQIACLKTNPPNSPSTHDDFHVGMNIPPPTAPPSRQRSNSLPFFSLPNDDMAIDDL